jgi:hypothetical protein
MKTLLRPIGRVREMMMSTGLDISHFYDDLVISDFSVYILRFDSLCESRIHLYFNTDCEKTEKDRLYRCLLPESRIAGLDLLLSGTFSLEQTESTEEIKIYFSEVKNIG